MTKISIYKNNNKTKIISIEGHSNFDIKGKDIVCSAISAITTGFFNAIDQQGFSKDVEMSLKNRFATIKVNKSSIILEAIIMTFIVQLKTVEHVFPEYVQIKGEQNEI